MKSIMTYATLTTLVTSDLDKIMLVTSCYDLQVLKTESSQLNLLYAHRTTDN